jgi:hypothetical protein
MEDEFEKLVWETLSFYDPMTIEQIILDLDSEKIKTMPGFNTEELNKILDHFLNTKKVKLEVIDNDKAWIKVFPKRPWWKRFF